MVKGLETGKDKIQKICDALRKETLEPAKQEAREIVENAHLAASEIVREAKKKAEAAVSKAEIEINEKKKVIINNNLMGKDPIQFVPKKCIIVMKNQTIILDEGMILF